MKDSIFNTPGNEDKNPDEINDINFSTKKYNNNEEFIKNLKKDLKQNNNNNDNNYPTRNMIFKNNRTPNNDIIYNQNYRSKLISFNN